MDIGSDNLDIENPLQLYENPDAIHTCIRYWTPSSNRRILERIMNSKPVNVVIEHLLYKRYGSSQQVLFATTDQ